MKRHGHIKWQHRDRSSSMRIDVLSWRKYRLEEYVDLKQVSSNARSLKETRSCWCS